MTRFYRGDGLQVDACVGARLLKQPLDTRVVWRPSLESILAARKFGVFGTLFVGAGRRLREEGVRVLNSSAQVEA